MTIALGFKGPDAIALVTDSQMTKEGGLKFNGQKIFHIATDEWSVAMAFAGSADLMRPIYGELEWKLDDLEPDGAAVTAAVFMYLEEIAQEFAKKHRDKTIEFLCAVSDSRYGKALYSVRGKIVTATEREWIGVGDSSVIRYLADIFNQDMNARQCLRLGSYMVKQASSYIDGCGGPTQACLLSKGKVSDESNAANHLDASENEKVFRDAFLTGV